MVSGALFQDVRGALNIGQPIVTPQRRVLEAWGNYKPTGTRPKRLWGICGDCSKKSTLEALTAIQLRRANEWKV
jgi:hypothetical protein